jgi:hypothetical protein
MDLVKYAPWLVPLILIAMIVAVVTLRPSEHNTGQPTDKANSR